MADEQQAAAAAAPEGEEEAQAPKRNCMPVSLKIDMCIECERVVRAEKKMSFKAHCREKGVDPAQLRRWTKNIVQMKQAVEHTAKKKTKLVCTAGRRSALWKLRDWLAQFAEAKQSIGQNASVRQMAIQARKHDKSLRRMKRCSLSAMARRFMRSNGIVMRSPTHKSQEDPREKMETARAFLQSTLPRIHQRNRHPAFVANMDQTPHNPKDTEKRTLARRGAKTVNQKQIKTSVGRITGCLTVCADGTKLPPLLVCKAKNCTNGPVPREAAKFNSDKVFCAVQQNAWCDERVMLLWVDNTLKPHVAKAPAGIVPCLTLDKHTCHCQGSVARAIEDLGVEWDVLPGGCAGLIQPIDVGINRPWKNRLRCRLEDFTMEQDNFERLAPAATRPLMAKWAAESWDKVQNDAVCNSWRHKPWSHFPDEPTREVAFQDDDFDCSSSEDNDEQEEEEEDAQATAAI